MQIVFVYGTLYRQRLSSYSFHIPDLTYPQLQAAKGLNLHLKRIKQTEQLPQATGGARLWHLLHRNIEKRGIPLHTSICVKQLIKNHEGRVKGVLLENGVEIIIKN